MSEEIIPFIMAVSGVIIGVACIVTGESIAHGIHNQPGLLIRAGYILACYLVAMLIAFLMIVVIKAIAG